MRYLLLVFLLLVSLPYVHGQELSFKDSIAAYNAHRLSINDKGMKVLGAWGIANIAEGGIGYFTAKQDQWKYFSEMNVLWGVANAGIAAFGLHGVRKEMSRQPDVKEAYLRYLVTKRIYLINIGLDVVYIAAGTGLAAYGATTKDNSALYKGFGSSIAIQGVFLLLFDNVMFATHQKSNSKWYELINEITITNKGVGFSHTF